MFPIVGLGWMDGVGAMSRMAGTTQRGAPNTFRELLSFPIDSGKPTDSFRNQSVGDHQDEWR